MLAMAAAKAADQYWAGANEDGFGYWNGATSWATAAGLEGSAAWTAGNVAVFTNATPGVTNVIDLGKQSVSVSTILFPNGTSAQRTYLTITNGTFSMTRWNERENGNANYLKNAVVTFGSGCSVTNNASSWGLGINKDSHIVFETGSTFTELNSGLSNGNEGCGQNYIGASAATSNSVTVCNGAKLTFKRPIAIAGTYGPKSGGNANSIGVLHVKGGTITSTSNLGIGCGVASTSAAGWYGHNSNGKGYYIQDGGNVTVNTVMMGSVWNKSYQSYKSSGYFTLNAGSFTCEYFDMNYNGTVRVLTLNGGTLWIKHGFMFKTEASGKHYVTNSKLYLNGGVLKVGEYLYTNDNNSSPSTSGGIWFNGTTLQPTASFNTDNGNGTKNFAINAGGLKINTASGITFGLYQQVTGGTGALTKQGAGTVNVNRQLLSTGGVAVSAGTLNFTASGNILSGGPLVMTGGTFNCTNATLASRVEVSPGARIASSGTLTFNSNTSLKLGFNTSSNNSSAFSDQQKIKAAGISVGSGIVVPITFETGTSFPLGDTYVLIKDANLSNANKFAVTSATANGVDITDCVYLDVESGNLVLKRKPYFTIKVR